MTKSFYVISLVISILVACFITRKRTLSETKLYYDLGTLKWFFIENNVK